MRQILKQFRKICQKVTTISQHRIYSPNPSPKPRRIRHTINAVTDSESNGVKMVVNDHSNPANNRTDLPPILRAAQAPITWKYDTKSRLIIVLQMFCTLMQTYQRVHQTWLVKYPKAKDESIHPWTVKVQWYLPVIGIMAIGMITRSAAFMKFAAEHNIIIRDVLSNIRFLIIACLLSISASDRYWH